ncbi:hypothetical protein V866_005832 [Kwoniella sp. B9012]|uniref:Uncharacterized protein n=1 Tax=Kwoniella europaea PYCC6329 TaxID=1423913 RepID=A0AAX4KQ87_9TREE
MSTTSETSSDNRSKASTPSAPFSEMSQINTGNSGEANSRPGTWRATVMVTGYVARPYLGGSSIAVGAEARAVTESWNGGKPDKETDVYITRLHP